MVGRDAARRAARARREPVSQTGDWHASGRSRSPSSIMKPLPALDRAAERLVLEAVAERGEHHDRPDPRRLDPAPRAVRLLPLPHPALGGGDRAAADRAGPARRPRLAGPRADLAQVDVGGAHRAAAPSTTESGDDVCRAQQAKL